jgi:RimJ/RimL family protein N-acetyltransferase
LTAQVQWPYQAGTVRKNFIEKIGPAIACGEEWHWTLRLKDDPEQIIGLISLYRSDDNNRGFWIGRRWQGKGLMSEAVETITDYWFDTLGFERLRVPKAIDNAPSRRISERTGMRVIAKEERDYVCGRFMSELWEITADEWHEYKAKR